MYRPKSTRARIIQRTVVYSLMSAAVIAVVTVLVLLMLGYRLNRDNALQQGGLVQFASRPSGATVTLGSAKLGSKTPSKITAYEGDYTVTFERKDYKPWQKDVTVKAGSVLWLNYAQLIPNQIPHSDMMTLAEIKQAVASPNGKFFALRAGDNTYQVADVSGNEPELTNLTLPNSLAASEPATATIVGWSHDSERLLIRTTNRKTTDWFIVERDNPKDALRLSDTSEEQLQSVKFDPRSSSRVFVRDTSGTIELHDLDRPTEAPVVLAKKTKQWSFIDDRALLYTTIDSKEQLTQVSYRSFGASESRVITELEGTARTLVAGGEYFSDIYIATAQTKPRTLRILQLPDLPSSGSSDALTFSPVTTERLSVEPNYLSVRTGGRFVVVQGDARLATYDIELQQFYGSDIGRTPAGQLTWLDRYHYTSVNRDNQLVMSEFDGANAHEITTVDPAFDSILTNNSKFLYSFRQSDDGVVLQRSQLIL